MFIFERESERVSVSMSRGGAAEREGDRIRSRLQTSRLSTQPDAGLEPTNNCEFVT